MMALYRGAALSCAGAVLGLWLSGGAPELKIIFAFGAAWFGLVWFAGGRVDQARKP